MATHSSTFAWRTPWTEEQDRQHSVRSQSRTWLCDFLFHSSTSDHQAQISEVGDPCSSAHTSRSPWRGCFTSCLVIPRGGGVLARLALLCCSRLRVSVPGALPLHVTRHCALELRAVRSASAHSSRSWGVDAAISNQQCRSEVPDSRPLHVTPSEQVTSNWTQTEKKKVRPYFITQILFLLPGNC